VLVKAEKVAESAVGRCRVAVLKPRVESA